MKQYFEQLKKINYEGQSSTNPLAFRHYNPKEVILGKTMEEHLRFASCYWHTFCWPGTDMFGDAAFDYPWQKGGDVLRMAKYKADVAFEFFTKLGVPYYCFHDADIVPSGNSIKEYIDNFSVMVDVLEQKQTETGLKLLWGTANGFSRPCYSAGAATNPNPEIYALIATQVVHVMNATKRLGGENYVLWGGREGYETLLNTDLKQERLQLGRFMQSVVEYKHKIGFNGTILIEPKPQEPTKHQYDFDVATVYGFLKQYGLEEEIKVNIEANHATLAGHSFHHEVAIAISLDIFGSLDANRGDPQCGWDTDQFPISVEENTLVMYEILKAGGLKTGGLNFDAKIRRQSTDKYAPFYGHIGAMDVMALSLKLAAKMIEDGKLKKIIDNRYVGWKSDFAKNILAKKMSLDEIAAYAIEKDLKPTLSSGDQEKLENLINRYIFG